MTSQTARLLRQERGQQLRWGRPPRPVSKDYDPAWSALLTSLPDYSDHPQFSVYELIGPDALSSEEIKARVHEWHQGRQP